jgi:predicted dehydrogenase
MTLNIGVLGLGHWGPNLVRCFSDTPRVNVVAVCDVNEASFSRVEAIIKDGCMVTTNPGEIFDNPDVGAVAIATPATLQRDLVLKALDAGKHVFCEKPFGFERSDIEQIKTKATNQDRRVMVGYTFLFNAGIRMLKNLMDSGQQGKTYYLSAVRTHLGLVRSDVDVIWDLASHDIAIMNYLLDDVPQSASVSCAYPLGLPRCDVAFINLKYASGIIGQIQVSWCDANKVRQIQVVGSEARLTFDDLNNLEPVRVYKKGIGAADQVEPSFGEFRYLVNDGDIVSPKVKLSEPLKVETNAFADFVLDRTPMPSTIEFAANVSACLNAISKSAANGGTPFDVE